MNTSTHRSLLDPLLLSIAPLAHADPTATPPTFDAAKLAAIPQRMKQLIDQHEIAGAVILAATRDKVKGVVYVLMVQRANFPNSDNSPVRQAFQEAAAEAVR